MPDPQTPPATPPPGNPATRHPGFDQPPAGPNETRPAQVYMTPEAYQAILAEREELLALKAKAEKDAEAKEGERLAALAKAGQVEEALAETRKQAEAKARESDKRYQTVETAWLNEKRTAAIAEALNGRAFVGEKPETTAALVRKLLSDEIEASLDTQGNPAVYDRTTRRPAAEYLKDRLQSPDFAIFFKADNRGGAGADGARHAGGGQSEDPTDAYMRKLRETREAAIRDPSRIYQA